MNKENDHFITKKDFEKGERTYAFVGVPLWSLWLLGWLRSCGSISGGVDVLSSGNGDKGKTELHFDIFFISLTLERVMVESNVAFIVADAPPPHAERECCAGNKSL